MVLRSGPGGHRRAGGPARRHRRPRRRSPSRLAGIVPALRPARPAGGDPIGPRPTRRSSGRATTARLPSGRQGVWQRFATKWAIAFTDSSHGSHGPVRLLRRNANSMTRGTACSGPRRPSQHLSFRQLLVSSGAIPASHGRRTGFGVAARLRTARAAWRKSLAGYTFVVEWPISDRIVVIPGQGRRHSWGGWEAGPRTGRRGENRLQTLQPSWRGCCEQATVLVNGWMA
jgi:hypothetical protein